MELRAAYFCFLGILWCWTLGYPETDHQYTDKNGEVCFSNPLKGEPVPNRGRSENLKNASAELQRAREQAEIEYWRAVEAKARSLRNTPDTEVHRKGRPSLQEEPVSDSSVSKKVRYQKIRFPSWKNTPVSEPQRKKRRYSRRDNVALR